MRCLTGDECNAWRDDYSCRRQWNRQITCETPLDRLPWFTQALVEQLQPFDQAVLIVDQVVITPASALEKLRRSAGERRPILNAPGHLFDHDPAGFRVALQAALSEWIDLRALFSPPRHALVSDHDEFTTFFSESSGKIADVRAVLTKDSVRVADYAAEPP